MTMWIPQCMGCQRFYGWVDGKEDYCCEAFPDGIPSAVWDNTKDHTKPVAGDHGLRYVPLQGLEKKAGEKVNDHTEQISLLLHVKELKAFRERFDEFCKKHGVYDEHGNRRSFNEWLREQVQKKGR